MNEDDLAATTVVDGRIDLVQPDGTVTGWSWSPDDSETGRTVAVLADGAVAATATCDEGHEFTVALAAKFLPPEREVVLELQDLQTGEKLGSPIAFKAMSPGHVTRPGLAMVTANLERIGEDGAIAGWCWQPSDPHLRVRIAVLVDGERVGITVADRFRADLLAGGIGDGRHGFTFFLPWSAFGSKSLVHVRLVADSDPGVTIASKSLRRDVALTIEERLGGVERDMRLLGARLDHVEKHAGRESAWVSSMLATIGEVFTRLALVTIDTPPDAIVHDINALRA